MALVRGVGSRSVSNVQKGRRGQKILLIASAVFSLLAVRVSAAPAEIGEWGPLIEGFPVPAVHSLMLHTGKILFFRGDGEDEGGVGDYRTHLMDLETFEFETFQMDANIFCASHNYLPDGRILVAGGEKEEDLGPVHVHIFDPVTEQWYRQPDMHDGRYYPTSIALGDGSSLIFAGRDPNGGDNPQVERFVPGGGPDGSNLIELLEGSDRAMTWYPRMHLLPSGRVFRAGQEQASYEFDPETGSWIYVADTNHGERYWGTSVVLPPGFERIMVLGGVNRNVTSFSTSSAEIIDLTDPSPSWRYTDSMAYPRMHVNVLVLPDGNVFVAGGMEDMAHTIPVYVSEMFDPETETWSQLPAQESVRSYHSTAVLLPDARVMWLGAHTATGGNNNSTAQIYSPAYLFQGPRPNVTSAPTSANYSETFLVDTPEAGEIEKVVFIRPSANTHSVNMSQRYVPLGFTQVDSDTLEIATPSNVNLAPPGYYMMFLVNEQGIPSEAPFIRLGGELPPVVEAGLDQDVILPAIAQLNGVVNGYGDPAALTAEWSLVSGPGPVTFTEPGAADTTAEFVFPGSYTLRLTAYDGPYTVSDMVAIVVHPEGQVAISVAGSGDDAEEKADGTITLTSLDLEMFDYDAGGPHNAIGVRFNGVGIANGTQIDTAYVQFTAAETGSAGTTMTIAGEDVDNAQGFTTSLNDISSRPTTGATVPWVVAPWTAGASGVAQQTANVAPIIQEIVNRPGWSEGNSLVLVFSGAGSRVADSYNSSSVNAAKLHVDPAGSQACADGLDNDSDGFADFPDDPGCTNVGDPSELDAARVCDDGLDNDGDTLIDYPADSGCVSLIDGSESEFEALCIDGLDNDADGLIDFPDDPGCDNGDDNSETGPTLICDDGLDNDVDGLTDYPLDPGCNSPTDTSELDGLIILDIPVSTGSDDAEQKADGSITVTSLDLEMFEYDSGGPHQAVGLRFGGIDVPQGATVSNAYIQFEAAGSNSIATNVTIEGEASDNAPTFTTALNDLTLRSRTLSSITWEPPPWIGGNGGPDQRTVDISPILDEIVDRSGWVPGGAMVFLMSGTGERVGATYDASEDSAATLHLEFTTGPIGNTPPQVNISEPDDRTTVVEGNSLTFTGTASDDFDDDMSASLSWSSSIQGFIGNGATISPVLGLGEHVVTASATDSGSLTGSAFITVTVTAATVDVPNVTGQGQVTAEADIVAAGLTVGTVTTANSDTVAAGDVISQNPTTCTACALPGATVDLVISFGSAAIDVPNVEGLTQASAEADIVAAGLTVGAVTTANSDTVPSGNVISQNPAACTACATTGSAVDLVISIGSANGAPEVSITAPADDATIGENSQLTLTGTVNDAEDAGLEVDLLWTSSKDGILGTGPVVTATLSKGRHTITATVTDTGGLSGTDQIRVRVRKIRN